MQVGSLKSQLKRTAGGRVVKPICTYVRSLKKIAWLSDSFLFEPSPAYKGVFLLKRNICKYLYCHCIYKCIKNIDLLCWVYKKINSFLSFHPCWGMGVGTCKTNMNEQGVGWGGVKNWKRTNFLNGPPPPPWKHQKTRIFTVDTLKTAVIELWEI